MKVSLEKVSQVRRILTVETLAEAVDIAYKKALGKIRGEAKIPGFRKGKVPDRVIEQRFSEELSLEAIKQLVRDTYPEAISEVQANPLGDPQVEPQGKLEKGKPFTYKAGFEVYPEFTLESYEGLKLEREKIEVSDSEVETELRRLQHQMIQLEPAPESEIGPGMIAMVDFKGTAGGEPFAGSEAENYVVDFGAGTLLEEFEVKIEGMKASEERDIEFDYPENYFKKEIAGKRGAFRVKVKDVRKKIVPELNDDFAKELGKFGSLEGVRLELKKRIAEHKELVTKNMLIEKIMQFLIEKHKELEPPTMFIEAELGNMIEQFERQLRTQGKSLADLKIDPKEFVKTHSGEAANRARGYMVINAIAKKENIDVADGEVSARIEQIAAASRQPPAKVREHMEKNNLLGQVSSQLRFEKTLDFILSKAKIEEVEPKNQK